jgi:hypothetical protein
MIDIDAIEPVTLEELRARKRRLNTIFWTAHVAPLALPKPKVELPKPVIDIWPEPENAKPPEPGITPNKIIAEVCRFFGVSRTDLISARRTKQIVIQRHISMYLCKKLTLRSLPEIGRRHGGKDHTTVLHAVRRISALLAAADKDISININILTDLIIYEYGSLDIQELRHAEPVCIAPPSADKPAVTCAWTPHDHQRLKQLYEARKSNAEIAFEIDRSIAAIKAKISALKLSAQACCP